MITLSSHRRRQLRAAFVDVHVTDVIISLDPVLSPPIIFLVIFFFFYDFRTENESRVLPKFWVMIITPQRVIIRMFVSKVVLCFKEDFERSHMVLGPRKLSWVHPILCTYTFWLLIRYIMRSSIRVLNKNIFLFN